MPPGVLYPMRQRAHCVILDHKIDRAYFSDHYIAKYLINISFHYFVRDMSLVYIC